MTPDGAMPRAAHHSSMTGARRLIGYHASHEQHAPGTLLDLVRHAEAAGFDAAMCSDHFHPWTVEQGQAGYAWAWLGAALQATTRMRLGTVTAPGDRYHPAIIAQAAATLAQMYGGRFWFAVGSGEAINERITGAHWPVKAERNARLLECVDVMRALWRGEEVTHHGRVVVEEAQLYTLPERPPELIAAALTPGTAEWAGGWADGLITGGMDASGLRRMVDAFHRGGGEGRPLKAQVGVSWADTYEAALQGAHEEWGAQIFPGHVLADVRAPHQFSALRRHLAAETVVPSVFVSADLDRHAEYLRSYVDAGFAEIHVFNVNRRQREFIDAFAASVLHVLRE
jgi:coenzyme F420-dependent glucose-6-phosphate dehydrogenase